MTNPHTDARSESELAQYIRRFTKDTLELLLLVAEAQAVQWEAAPANRKPPAEVSGRSSGGVSDPTLRVTLDPQRLAVRAATNDAMRALDKAAGSVRGAHRSLSEALNQWADV